MNEFSRVVFVPFMSIEMIVHWDSTVFCLCCLKTEILHSQRPANWNLIDRDCCGLCGVPVSADWPGRVIPTNPKETKNKVKTFQMKSIIFYSRVIFISITIDLLVNALTCTFFSAFFFCLNQPDRTRNRLITSVSVITSFRAISEQFQSCLRAVSEQFQFQRSFRAN